ncbi:hypothetical protein SUGI_0734420 [Cryptomeria japonica]|nr:hypothetical protein SUGI_0734420 [Cryptomeria japonica]
MEMEIESGIDGDSINVNVFSLLAIARQKINQGNPSLALQAVVMAMKLCGGENAVMWTLQRAREMYQNRMQENSAAEELASLFAECAITDVLPDTSARLTPSNDVDLSGLSLLTDTNQTSILAKSGRVQVVMDAFADGSSFVCLQCGSLVSNFRKDEHFAYWCCAS